VVGLSQQAYADPVLSEEMIQFVLPAAESVSIQAGQPQGFSPYIPSRPFYLFGFTEKYDFEYTPRASWPTWEGWDGCEKPASELYISIKREVV